MANAGAQPRWRYMRFRFARDQDGEVRSFLDALVAHAVLAPVIETYETQLPLWRFHRRWPADSTGHQFSLIYYSPDSVAARVERDVAADPVLGRLMDDGYLVEHRVDLAEPARATEPGATSDRAWSPDMQREWPKFIMGASRMWLGLVAAEAVKYEEQPLYARYRAVETALDELWFQQGNHALFHHLSALFGYKPLRVIRRDIMTF